MAEDHGMTHGGKRRNAGRKRKHSGLSSSQKSWNSQHKRIYLAIKIFETWKESKIVAGYGASSDSDFAAHLLSLEYCRRYVLFYLFLRFCVYDKPLIFYFRADCESIERKQRKLGIDPELGRLTSYACILKAHSHSMSGGFI